MDSAYLDFDELQVLDSPMATTTVATLEERVSNHIKFFWVVVAGGFAWLAGISALMYTMNGTVGRVEKAQADAPFKIIASILKTSSPSREETADNLGAVSTILRSAKVMGVKPDSQTVLSAGTEILKAQKQYPDMDTAWKATTSFINYKSAAVLPAGVPESVKGTKCDGKFSLQGWVFEGCEINLEDLASRIRDNKVNGLEATFTFRKCIVHYSGGAIPAKHMFFVDSIFQFQVNKAPDPTGIFAMRQLAESTSSVFDIML